MANRNWRTVMAIMVDELSQAADIINWPLMPEPKKFEAMADHIVFGRILWNGGAARYVSRGKSAALQCFGGAKSREENAAAQCFGGQKAAIKVRLKSSSS